MGSPKLPDALEMEQLLSKAPLKRGFFLRSALLFEHQIVAVSPPLLYRSSVCVLRPRSDVAIEAVGRHGHAVGPALARDRLTRNAGERKQSSQWPGADWAVEGRRFGSPWYRKEMPS